MRSESPSKFLLIPSFHDYTLYIMHGFRGARCQLVVDAMVCIAGVMDRPDLKIPSGDFNEGAG